MGITNRGKAVMAKRFGGMTTAGYEAMAYLAFGADSAVSTPFAKTQDNLAGTEHGREAAVVASATTTDADDTVQFSASFSVSSSITAREVGVFNTAGAGVAGMGARTVLPAEKVLTNGSTYAVVYKVITSAA